MQQNRFINNKVFRIDLDGGDWIEIKDEISFAEYREFLAESDYGKGDILKSTVPFLKKCIVAWGFADAEGEIVEVTPENIDKLNARTVLELTPAVFGHYNPEKKSSEPSGQTSGKE